MNKLFVCLVSLFLSTPLFAVVEIDQTAPNFQLIDSKGNVQELEQFRGKKVILEWTNHECPFVQKHYSSGNMQGLQKRFTDEDVVWLSIISSAEGNQGYVTADQADELTESRGAAPSFVLLDPSGDVGRTYGAQTTPHMYIVDEEGVLRYNGAIDSVRSANPADIEGSDNYIELGMASLAAGEQIKTSLTRPYGCSVKYKK